MLVHVGGDVSVALHRPVQQRLDTDTAWGFILSLPRPYLRHGHRQNGRYYRRVNQSGGVINMGKSLYQKLYYAHVGYEEENETLLLYIDRYLVHEVTSQQAFDSPSSQ
ncbi:hypothetical protein BG74_06235 [Sodalis-like endosymbiont of Proechinophthirus fluctus]|nr:hypothetical protein BG74_06235 [Sodalis-like endosymbiont of Proechinophthirus fluctus]